MSAARYTPGLVLCSVLLLHALVGTWAKSKWDTCDSDGGATVEGVDVSGCDELDRCPLKHNQNVTITIRFKVDNETPQLTSVVNGGLGGVFLPFQKGDACKASSGLECPLKTGQTHTFTDFVRIRPSYPAIPVTVRYKLMEGRKSRICVLIPSKIVKAR